MATNTVALRSLISSLLKTSNRKVYYEKADDEALYPYIVYQLTTINTNNFPRADSILTIDVWDRGYDSTTVEQATDFIQDLLNMEHKVNKNVLATFYLQDRKSLEDEDEEIKRRQLKFSVEIYYI